MDQTDAPKLIDPIARAVTRGRDTVPLRNAVSFLDGERLIGLSQEVEDALRKRLEAWKKIADGNRDVKGAEAIDELSAALDDIPF